MPPKRRLSATSGGDDGDEDSKEQVQEPGRKKKKMDPGQQMQAVFDFIRKYKKEDGAELCGSMVRLPNKRSDPGYYDTVVNPIDIMKIQQKLKTDEYETMDDLKSDFELMVANTKLYYKRGSPEYRDAQELENLLGKAVGSVMAGEDPSQILGDREDSDLGEFLEELFGAIMTAADATEPSRLLNIVFQLLPSRKRYPEYYEHITEPMDLKTVAEKIQKGQYKEIPELEKDLQLIFSNARSFNEPGSQIYKDAGVLSKLSKSKALDCQASLTARQARGSRSSRRQSRQVYSQGIAALQYEDSESESDEDSDLDDMEGSTDPLWKLYSAVRNYTTERGVEIAEVFLSLPSKRELPDYYQTISQPISLNQIRRKIRNGEYPTLQHLGEDMEIMFNNCKTYNRQDSKLWKDGNKLQKIMNTKLEELLEGGDDLSAPATPGPEKMDVEVKKASPKDPKDQLKKRLKVLFNSIYLWANSDNIQPIGVFLEVPSRKDYPDYYDIITEPIDMNMIEQRIKTNQYKSEEELMADCKLMFSNCRLYNEEGSGIYEDANILERVLLAKAKEIGVLAGDRMKQIKRKTVSLQQKVKTLYDTLKDYRDAKGRQLSLIFLKLPSKHEYPDYYDIIKRPIDLEKISSKIRNNMYETMEDAVADFTLVFDNAAKYNEPDSQIYKDAQTLARLAHQTVRHLTEDGDGIPDAKAALGDILNSIYTSMFTAQDNEERCFADSLAEVQEHDEVNGKKVRALSLEILKRRVDRGLYKRLDLLQRDVFLVLERARKLSRTDSQVWEDSVELSRRFIKARDQYTENGARLKSKALEYTLEMLEISLQSSKEGKAGSEVAEEENNDGMLESGTQAWSGMNNGMQYNVGDFVYVSAPEVGGDPQIFMVERLFEKNGANSIWGGQYFRQRETFHVPTRTFYEKEVMRGDVHSAIPISSVLGKCYVMPVKDYHKFKPVGFEEKDIYVCEWRYTSKIRNWKKIKPTAFWEPPSHIKIVPREKPLEPKRVPSVFKERIEKHKEDIEELEILEKTVEEDIPANIKWTKEGEDDGLVYWEQYTIPGPITLRRGDHVLVRGENNRNMVAQIDTMWTGQDNMAYFHGPWFVTPVEIPSQIGRTFYKAEAFLSSISDSNPLLSVVGKCSVLDMSDYCNMRPTQHAENDVYCCESLFDEGKRLIMPLNGSLKKYQLSPAVQQDEVYMFKRTITPEKETLPPPTPRTVSSPMLENEDSMDAPPSVGSVESASPAPIKKKKFDRKKLVTAYILFSADVRKITMEENPGVQFGEISRIVAERWRQMTDPDKQVYAERAKKVNEEKEKEEARKEAERIRMEEERKRAPPPPAPSPGPVNNAPPSPLARARNESGGLRSEPLFHSVPPRPQRLLHSEAYIKYIEGLNKDSRSMCNWDRQLNASQEAVRPPDESKLPVSWLAGNTGEHATSMDALWALRDFMLQEALGVVKIM